MKPNLITAVILTLIVLAGGYWFFTSRSGTQAPLTASNPVEENPAQTQFQALVSQLQPVSFTTDIFSDPRFTALVDLTTPISPESSGRLDPFAPVAGTSGI